MTSLQSYKNSFFVDVLEFCKIVTIKETLPQNYKTAGATEANKSEYSVDQKSDVDSENQDASEKSASENEEFDPFLVSWNGTNDPDLPLNWTTPRKAFMIFQIMLLTCITYMGSSIYTPGQEEIQHEFKVGQVTATLNLSLYVLGYGIGPVIFSPLSEIAKVGRQQIYIVTLFFFMIFQIGCATVHNIGGLIVMRFIAGILCSPSLATGGASIADLVSPDIMPALIGLWAIGAVAAPVLAPLLGAAMVDAKNWRWIFWLLMWMCAAALVLFIFCFPETSHANILSRRASRLRKQTGDNRYYTAQEKIDDSIEPKDFIIKTVTRPIMMMVKEPIVLAFNLYISLCYGAFYLFFEAFPIVFVGIYHFTLVEMGLAYMGFLVGCAFAYCGLLVFLMKVVLPKYQNNTFTPETFLLLAMACGWCLPLSLFLFGWAAGTHWIVPIIAELFFVIATFNIFQATFAYLSMSYPKYVASVFASNSLSRSAFACAFPLFGTAMYNNLAIDGYPVGWGSSLVGFFTIALALIPFALYKYGPLLRSKSKFSD
ncbi:fluconazole resistance protein 1 [Monosporozyma servazzii]